MLYLKSLMIELLICHNRACLLTSFDRLKIIKMLILWGNCSEFIYT